jgi:hypothetical protein
MCVENTFGWSLIYLQVVDNMERALFVENTSAAPAAGDSLRSLTDQCSSSDPLNSTYLSSIKETIKSFAEGLKMTHTGTFTFSFVYVCWSLSRFTKGMLGSLKEHAIVKVILRGFIWPAIWLTCLYTDTHVIFYGIMNYSFFCLPIRWGKGCCRERHRFRPKFSRGSSTGMRWSDPSDMLELRSNSMLFKQLEG